MTDSRLPSSPGIETIGVRRLEEMALNAWPSFATHIYDGWILRHAEGYTKRANSVIPLYPSTIELEQKIDRSVAFYSRLGLPAIFKMTAESTPSSLDDALSRRGFAIVDPSSVQIATLDSGACRHDDVVTVGRQFSDSWFDGYAACSRLEDPSRRMSARRLLSLVPAPLVVAHMSIGGRIVSCGFGAIEGELVGIFDIVTDPEFRRRGFAEAIVRTLMRNAALLGARTAYLQVIVANREAQALYQKLGFVERYRYWYRVSATS